MNIIDYIEEAKEKLRCESYNQTMKMLGMSRQQWTAIQKGSGINDENALRLARLLKINPLEIIAKSKMLRAKNRETREFWAKIKKDTETQRIKEEKEK